MQKLITAVMKFIRSLYRLPPFHVRSYVPAKFVDVDYHFQVLTFHFQFVRRAQKMLYFLCLRGMKVAFTVHCKKKPTSKIENNLILCIRHVY